MFILVDHSRLENKFLLLRIHSFLPYNSPGAGAGAVLFLKGRSRSRRKSGGSETLVCGQDNREKKEEESRSSNAYLLSNNKTHQGRYILGISEDIFHVTINQSINLHVLEPEVSLLSLLFHGDLYDWLHQHLVDYGAHQEQTEHPGRTQPPCSSRYISTTLL